MVAILPFVPIQGTVTGRTVSLTVASATSVSTTMTLAPGGNTILATNVGVVTMFIRISGETVPVASTLDVPILTNTQFRFGVPASTVIGVATVSSSTTGTVFFTPGE